MGGSDVDRYTYRSVIATPDYRPISALCQAVNHLSADKNIVIFFNKKITFTTFNVCENQCFKKVGTNLCVLKNYYFVKCCVIVPFITPHGFTTDFISKIDIYLKHNNLTLFLISLGI